MIGLWVELEWKVLQNCKWMEIGIEIRSGIRMGNGRIMVIEKAMVRVVVMLMIE